MGEWGMQHRNRRESELEVFNAFADAIQAVIMRAPSVSAGLLIDSLLSIIYGLTESHLTPSELHEALRERIDLMYRQRSN